MTSVIQENNIFLKRLNSNEIPVLFTTTQLSQFNTALDLLKARPCTTKDLIGVHATICGIPYAHGIIRNRGQLPNPPADTHLRIDLVKTKVKIRRKVGTKKIIKRTRKISLGRIRLVLTKHGFHELHVKVHDNHHQKGYGILLYMLASLQAFKLGMDLCSSTHPSVAAHRIYYSSRFTKFCEIAHLPNRYEIYPTYNALNLLEELFPEMKPWEEGSFNYRVALAPHKKVEEYLKKFDEHWEEAALPTNVIQPTITSRQGISDEVFFRTYHGCKEIAQ